MCNLKYGINEGLCNRSRVTDTDSRLVVAKGEQAGRGME